MLVSNQFQIYFCGNLFYLVVVAGNLARNRGVFEREIADGFRNSISCDDEALDCLLEICKVAFNLLHIPLGRKDGSKFVDILVGQHRHI